MIAYVTIGSNDLEKSCAFYEKIFEPLGVSRLMDLERAVVYGTSLSEPMILISRPFDGEPATVGNGMMVALSCKTPEKVDEIHAIAMSLDAENEGDAGPRGDQFYCGYFRDPDGNKINAFAFQSQG